MARYWMLGAGALGRPRGMVWGGRREEGSGWAFTFHFHALEKEMATHSSILAWRIPGTGKRGWAAVYGVAQSRTRLKRLSSSSSRGMVSA